MKKIISIALLLVITLSSTVAAHAGSIFPDVADNVWYIEYVKEAVESGMVKGYDDGTFKPNKELTYAEFITMMVEQQTTDEKICKTSFNHWGVPYYNMGLKLGYFTEGQISITKLASPIPRKDMALIACGYLKKNADVPVYPPVKGYNDMKSNDPYEYYISVCSVLGVLEGYPDGSFKPDNTLKRCEAVKVAVCCLERKAQKESDDRRKEFEEQQKWINQQKPATEIAPEMKITGNDAAGNVLVSGIDGLIPSDRKAVFEDIFKTLKISKENGKYYLSWTQKKIPDYMEPHVDLLVYSNQTDQLLYEYGSADGAALHPEIAAAARKAQTVKEEITGCGKLEDRNIILDVKIHDFTNADVSMTTTYQFIYNYNGKDLLRIKHEYLDKTYKEETALPSWFIQF